MATCILKPKDLQFLVEEAERLFFGQCDIYIREESRDACFKASYQRGPFAFTVSVLAISLDVLISLGDANGPQVFHGTLPNYVGGTDTIGDWAMEQIARVARNTASPELDLEEEDEEEENS